MTPETKKYLLLGGGLIAATVIGIVVYKKYEVDSQASKAANDQSTQDQLAYIESMAMSGPYAQDGGGVSSAVTLPSPPAMPSLVDQLSQIEHAFGLAPPAASPAATPASAPTSGATSSGSRAPAATPWGGAYSHLPPAARDNWRWALPQEGVLVA